MDTLRLRVVVVGASVVLQALMPAAQAASPSPSASAEAPGSAQSARLVSQIAARLGQASGVRARFTQTQIRAALKQPLISSGSLLLMRGRGVSWHIETPYQATYLITDAGVSEVNAAAQRGGSSPHGARGVAEVSRMIRAMLGGDLSALYSQFDVRATGTPAQWRMQLTPNQPQLAQAIKNLQMNGGSYLRSLNITLANGDVTTLDFSDSTTVTDLTSAEQQLFGAP
ncbi:LolA family protein [Burkholderia pyrrocinia]|uniref:LolA family protein n=1 Tax=Burkholderia pyrrocinia TaxID=60550 RepID=UPI00158831FE|nr:outer membrane lipoprotein carrier protein LolA [Burkholderia pyrrocinia]